MVVAFRRPSSLVPEIVLRAKAKGFLPPDSGSSGPQVENGQDQGGREAFFFRRSIAGFPRGVTS